MGQEFTGPAFSRDDKVDGEWWVPNPEEAMQGKLRAWKLLIGLLDTRQVIQDELCELAAQHLRSAFSYQIAEEVIDLLAVNAANWPAMGKAKLREAIPTFANLKLWTTGFGSRSKSSLMLWRRMISTPVFWMWLETGVPLVI